jgi:hypothetical protein
MLYVIGGASRSGKTLLARRAVAEKQIPYFPIDALFGALVHGAPEMGIRYEDSFTKRPIKMWPITKHFLDFFFKEEQKYLIEGDSILPSQINKLIIEQKPVKCCFLGYAELTKEEKLSLVRQYHQGDIDWTKGISDEEMLPMIDKMIEFSKFLREECTKYKIKYFDISHDFEGVRDQAFKYLFIDSES